MTYINDSLNEKHINQIDGIIGGDILIQHGANIDFHKKELRLNI
tara:strand:- start:364 stop:495 length:132 start_codon:yes stop_codon:yes gene_type:complete